MKLNHWASFLILCVLLTACERVKENAGANSNAPANDRPVAHDSGQKAGERSDPVAQTNSSPPANSAEKQDFAGTAGVTEKKYETKAVAVLSAVRVAAQDGYDRVTFEFEGAELPSYHIEYIDKPVRACGSGNVVPLKGDGWLEIGFTPAAAHTEAGEPTVQKRELAPNLKIIRELKSTCDFEAEVEWVLGVSSPNKYRVLELKNPTRLAIDIKH